MEDFNVIEKENYRTAERRRYQTADFVVYFYNICVVGLKIIGIMLKEIFMSIVNPIGVKNISGQLALVTGENELNISRYLNRLKLNLSYLISGGANGLGRAIANKLAGEGCDIVIVDINESEAEKAAKQIQESFNVKVKAYKVDVSDFEAIQRLKTDIEIDFPGQSVDILVNNAGILSGISLREGQYQQIQKVIDVNLASHFWV
jgi:hypothetical protein